jgi:hypothetical protein
MGTRGITKVIYEGDVKVAQYGQWDHYPSGQGKTVFEFLRGADNITKLKNGITNHTFVPSENEYEAMVGSFTNENGWMNMDQAEAFSKQYPSLTRDTGAGILDVISNATGTVPLFLDLDFENDELMCEGVYTINLDDETFTTKYNGEETVIRFEDIYTIGIEDYLVRSKCGVYEYHQTLDNAAVA